MESKIYVEWINGNKADLLYKARRDAEIASARELDPTIEEEKIVPALEDDSKWNWVAMEECFETRVFSTVEEAKEWAEANSEMDYFGRPEIKKVVWDEGGSEANAQTVLNFTYEGGGEWLE